MRARLFPGAAFPASCISISSAIILIEVNESNKGLEVEKVPCPSEERQRTYDQLIIHVSGKELDKVPFVVMPYLIPDVPIYLLWGQDPTLDDKVLPFFKNFASRVIFDASSTDDLSAFAERALKRGSPTGDNFMDISWAGGAMC